MLQLYIMHVYCTGPTVHRPARVLKMSNSAQVAQVAQIVVLLYTDVPSPASALHAAYRHQIKLFAELLNHLYVNQKDV